MLTNTANIRRHLGISQKRLAREVGVAQATMCRYERGQRTPGLTTTLRIAAVLGVSVEDLAGKGLEDAA